MKKDIEAILNDLSNSNDYNLKYIPEHNYNELTDKVNALFSLHDVGCSLPNKEEMEIGLEILMANKQESFKTKYDKLTFKLGFRTCFYWLNKKLNK